jgi:hypothetical protein
LFYLSTWSRQHEVGHVKSETWRRLREVGHMKAATWRRFIESSISTKLLLSWSKVICVCRSSIYWSVVPPIKVSSFTQFHPFFSLPWSSHFSCC